MFRIHQFSIECNGKAKKREDFAWLCIGRVGAAHRTCRGAMPTLHLVLFHLKNPKALQSRKAPRRSLEIASGVDRSLHITYYPPAWKQVRERSAPGGRTQGSG